jgi:hypothetical protein
LAGPKNGLLVPHLALHMQCTLFDVVHPVHGRHYTGLS